MDSSSDQKKKSFLLNVLSAAAVLVIVWFCFVYLLPVLSPFLAGYLIAVLAQPLAGFLRGRLRFGRKVAGVVSALLFVAVFGALLVLGFNRLFSELSAVLGMLPTLLTRFSHTLSNLIDSLSGMANYDIAKNLGSGLKDISSELSKMSSVTSGLANVALGTVSRVPGMLLWAIVAVVSACFISSDYPDIRGFFLRQLPEKYQEWAMEIKNFFFITIARLLRAYLTLMLITFAELCIWFLILGVPHAVMMAALIAVVDILPILGTGTVVIPWALVEMVIGNWMFGLMLLLMYVCITIVRNFLEPKIVGYHIGLYPLVTLISMYIGLKTFGAAGMFLFPITIIIIKHLHDQNKIRLWND